MGNNVALTIEGDIYYKAKFEKSPFAYGASRAAYRGKLVAPRQLAGTQVVVKAFKREYAMHRTDWETELETSKKAEELAQEFNHITGTNRPIHFIQPITMIVTDTHWLGCTGCTKDEWVVAEMLIPGKYTKWTSNAGLVNEAQMGGGGSLPAFSHWTWVKTNGEMVVCDLQGVRYDNPMLYLLTDPAINSCSSRYGKTDLGRFGINAFFQSHRCTQFCRDLGLAGNVPPPEMDPLSVFLSALFAPKRSTSYSDHIKKIAERVMRASFAVVEEGSDEDESEDDERDINGDSSEQEETSDLQNGDDDSEFEQDSELDKESEDNDDSELEEGTDSYELRIGNEQEDNCSDDSELEQDSECDEESEFNDESELQDSDKRAKSSDDCKEDFNTLNIP